MKDTEDLKSTLKENSIRHFLDEHTIVTLDHYLGKDGKKHLESGYAGAVALTMIKIIDGMTRNSLCHLQLCPKFAAFAEYPDVDNRLSAFHCGIDFIRNFPEELPLQEFFPDPEAGMHDYNGPLGISLIYPDKNRQMHIHIRSLYSGIPYERLYNIGIDADSVIEESSQPETAAFEEDPNSKPAWCESFVTGVFAAMDHMIQLSRHC